ncbi:hypothetical protein [Microvirga zambiensis]|uniref:hypothetical protein n=1 Tax=Microvirga zambiensis TaxID=1402137 RepID=UPI00191D47E0|nr:hypothetical protein [Microvirga zambiensis]
MTKTDVEGGKCFPSLSLIGAGRLGLALESRLRFKGANVPLWSRRYESAARPSPPSTGDGNVVSFETVAKSDVLLSAIPNQALLRLTARQQLRTFDGVVFAMGIDTSVQCIREVLSQALVIRLSPAIPAGGGEITSVGLLDATASNDPRLGVAKAALELLGPVTWIDEEALYDLTTLLAGPLLTLLKSAISRTVEASLEAHQLPIQAKGELERTVFKELVRRSLGSSESTQQAEKERATPGGVTEIALRHKEQLSGQLLGIVELMLDRMANLRAEQRSQ